MSIQGGAASVAAAYKGKRCLVTGGAGFIGSHLVDGLLAHGAEVTVLDNFSTGTRAFLAPALKNPKARLVEGDVLAADDIRAAVKGQDIIFHASADPEVRFAGDRTDEHLRQNVMATHRVLEAMRFSEPRRIVFTSTSTVYGDANVVPTPEGYGPCEPISVYGAAKLASESLISSYCGTFDFQGVSLRFANIVGPRSNHGVTFDFHRKLMHDGRKLEILGDGKQNKSYCHVADTVSGIMAAEVASRGRRYDVFNVGSEDMIDVTTIAGLVCEEMGLRSTRFEYTGGVDGGRGWKGDVKVMRLAVDKLKATGWRPKHGSAAAIRDTARSLVQSHQASSP
ncbi:MAG: NAD-dependent epimerase/dehydratase family protein [Thermoplasmatota archaeon]